MPTSVIEYFRRIVLPDVAGLGDGELLGGFIERHDEAALAALVRRHGPMVWGVCRRLLSHHDAEDAFQAAFLVLVRKAASIVPREMVGNWLYGVARQTALEARRTAARRRAREVQVTVMPDTETVQQDRWPDVQPLLDQELSRLPDNYRAVIVLCDLEGRTRKEVARQLGVPEGTVAGRLARARAMLAKRLTQRGVTLSGGALAAVLSQNVASAGVAPSVVSSTIKAASLFAAGQAAATGAISVNVAALTEGVLKTMMLTKLKVAAVVFLIVAALSSAAGLFHQTQAAEQPKAQAVPGKGDKEMPAAKKDQKAKSDKELLQGTWVLVSWKIDGRAIPLAEMPKGGKKCVIRGTEFTPAFMRGKGFTVKLDSEKEPKAIDLQPKENPTTTFLGIYKVDGDTLKICFRDGEIEQRVQQERPTSFGPPPEDGIQRLIFRREEKQPATNKDEQRKGEKNDDRFPDGHDHDGQQ